MEPLEPSLGGLGVCPHGLSLAVRGVSPGARCVSLGVMLGCVPGAMRFASGSEESVKGPGRNARNAHSLGISAQNSFPSQQKLPSLFEGQLGTHYVAPMRRCIPLLDHCLSPNSSSFITETPPAYELDIRDKGD